MPIQVRAGEFHEFCRFRPDHELGERIEEKRAIENLKQGKDVYTLRRADAFRLARAVFPVVPVEHLPTNAAHFRHFHAGDVRKADDEAGVKYGHAFFSTRGEGLRLRPTKREPLFAKHNVQRHG